MSVFYSFSNYRETTQKTYNYVSDKLENIIIDVDKPNNQNSHQLLDKINNWIESATLFVCDITPDTMNENIEYINPNVMFELGYALQLYGKSNIILLLNENISHKIPSMLNGFDITYYDSTQDDYYDIIVNKIIEMLDNINITENNIENNWINFNYTLSNTFFYSISDILDIKIVSYSIRINKQYKKAVLLFFCNGGYPRKLNIIKKKLYLKNKTICLSNFEHLYNEIKHIELIINFEFNVK
jgi:hypothetical protein